jgi:hypothetical protein
VSSPTSFRTRLPTTPPLKFGSPDKRESTAGHGSIALLAAAAYSCMMKIGRASTDHIL